MEAFNPNEAADEHSGIFGLPYSPDQASLVLIPVPWEATTSYGKGTARGPQAIMAASKQIDLYDFHFGSFYAKGIAMLEEHAELGSLQIRAAEGDTASINALSKHLNRLVYEQTRTLLQQNKIVGIVGGDHSVPLGGIIAYCERYPTLSILHIDAHADLRCAYEGFTYSHASIMYNVLQETSLATLVQVGVRDYCSEELERIHSQPQRIKTFFDAELQGQRYKGLSFVSQCDAILSHLSQDVYLSFDIDGLDPRFCPHTGTPVPGGLDFNEIAFLLQRLQQRGHRIVGFDLCEVSPGSQGLSLESTDAASEWDANVGARVLFKLCGAALSAL